ncbi:hypothetical protein GSI_13685 [Ganoderma sinense ZZ0214-1]|uniref:Uncharacterized protein n=1 Tax=Ganoderma sinense ZZ0214-1 TaxID=1077348 RepID=A0A2G8RQZ8_9APHY|nr:hypothetical protein GSI_13685 [Ganoderma sinense ZZ0214-1]
MVESSQCISSPSDCFLVPGKDEESFAPLLVSQGDLSNNSEDLNPFASPVGGGTIFLSPGVAGSPGHRTLHLDPSSAPPPPSREDDVEGKLRAIVDDLLHKKRAARDARAEESAALRAQITLLEDALTKASAQPGSETADLLAALEHERGLRLNAEESRAATGKYLAEQIERVSLQKTLLEKTVASFTHGREFWRERAIAALERCEMLEEENMRVKTQLSALAKRQESSVDRQISDVLREVAEERDRLKQLEAVHPFSEKTNTLPKSKDKMGTIKASRSKSDSTKSATEGKFFGGKTGRRFVSYRIAPGLQQSKKERA